MRSNDDFYIEVYTINATTIAQGQRDTVLMGRGGQIGFDGVIVTRDQEIA